MYNSPRNRHLHRTFDRWKTMMLILYYTLVSFLGTMMFDQLNEKIFFLFFIFITSIMLTFLIQQNWGSADKLHGRTSIGSTKEKIPELSSFYRAILDSANYMIISTDCRGIIQTFNRAAERCLGFSASEVIGKSTPLLFHDFHEVMVRAEELSMEFNKGVTPGFQVFIEKPHWDQVDEREWTYIRKDGSSFPVMLSFTELRDEQVRLRGYLCVGYDLTERKKLEEMLLKSEKLSVVGQLAAGVAHEIRNPLTVVKGFAQLLQRKSDHDPVYFHQMNSEIERIESIISEFLLLAEPPKMLDWQLKEIEQIVSLVVSLVETQAILHNIQIITEFESPLPSIRCDENQLKQVFVQILQNAIEAMPHGGEITITVKRIHGQQVLICIADQGCGIAKERLPRLGEPYYASKEKGTGLGLMISYKIIENHQGTISIESELHKGTTVYITLPATC